MPFKNQQTQPARDVEAVEITGEALVISSVVNTGDSGSLVRYGVTTDLFVGYVQEFSWIVDYVDKYGATPTRDIFRGRWPKFPLNEHDDVRSAIDSLMEHYFKSTGRKTLLDATDALGIGDFAKAEELLASFKPTFTAAAPVDLIRDTTHLDTYGAAYQVGIPVPFPTVQRVTGGIRPGNYWSMAARTGQGKSSYACAVALHAMLNGFNVKYYSLEMSEAEMRAKLHAGLALHLKVPGITARELLDCTVDRDDYKAFMEKLDEQEGLGSVHVHTPREGRCTPSVVASGIEEYDLVAIDLITLMSNNKGESAMTDWRVAAGISNDLKQLFLSSEVAGLVTAQVNRQGDHGTSPPQLGQLAQTDSIAQDSDVVWTQRAIARQTVTAHSIEKNRHGSPVRFWTHFKPNSGSYTEINKEQAEQISIQMEADQ